MGDELFLGDLTAIEARFAEEYVVDLDAAKALQRCGLDFPTTWNDSVFQKKGLGMLQRPEVRRKVLGLMLARGEQTGVTAATVLQELASLAFQDIRELMSWTTDAEGNVVVRFKDSDLIADGAARGIAKVKVTRWGTIEFEMYSKLEALKVLCQHLGLLQHHAKVELGGTLNMEHSGEIKTIDVTDDKIDELVIKLQEKYMIAKGEDNQ